MKKEKGVLKTVKERIRKLFLIGIGYIPGTIVLILIYGLGVILFYNIIIPNQKIDFMYVVDLLFTSCVCLAILPTLIIQGFAIVLLPIIFFLTGKDNWNWEEYVLTLSLTGAYNLIGIGQIISLKTWQDAGEEIGNWLINKYSIPNSFSSQ